MSQILLVSASTLVLWTFPGDAQDHSGDDGYLHSSNDGCDQDVVQLLSTGDDVEHIKVLRLSALRTFISGVAPAGGSIVLHFTGAVDAVASVATRTGHCHP